MLPCACTFPGKVPAALAAAGVREYVEYERRLLLLASACEPIPGVIVQLFEDEGDMIAAVRDELFVHKRVDFVTGHNVLRFDMEYMIARVCAPAASDAARRFLRFGALLFQTLHAEAKALNSSAFGSNRLVKLAGAGFVYIDTMLVCKTVFKLRENTLKAAAAEFLGGTASKFDMPYELIPAVCAGTHPGHWATLGAYCVQDSVLVLRLLAKWDKIKDAVAQSRIMNVPIAINAAVGQQVKVTTVSTI
jgi:DNA polymerase elongation subunit (family B)